jgi:hypothetical protein
LLSQSNQQPYQFQFQQAPNMQPQPPKKKSHKRFWYSITAIVVALILSVIVGTLIVNNSTMGRQLSKITPTQSRQFSTPATHAGTFTPSVDQQNIRPTHGSPVLNGRISDFIGAYGKPLTTNGKDSLWLLHTDGSLSLETQNTNKGVVDYLSVSMPESWNKQKAQAYCLTFAPHNYALYKSAVPTESGDLYIYSSPSGKFTLHVSHGYPLYCTLSSILNP